MPSAQLGPCLGTDSRCAARLHEVGRQQAAHTAQMAAEAALLRGVHTFLVC